MNETNIIKRINKLEAMAASIMNELAILRKDLTIKEPAPKKKATQKLEADIVGRRNARLIKK